MTTETEKRLDQLERDMAVLARLAIKVHGARRELVEITERHAVGGQENRPHQAPEQRTEVSSIWH
jgi:hypothetical protein